jgi:hypothetical protein
MLGAIVGGYLYDRTLGSAADFPTKTAAAAADAAQTEA